jgi:hypothetical protein
MDSCKKRFLRFLQYFTSENAFTKSRGGTINVGGHERHALQQIGLTA